MRVRQSSCSTDGRGNRRVQSRRASVNHPETNMLAHWGKPTHGVLHVAESWQMFNNSTCILGWWVTISFQSQAEWNCLCKNKKGKDNKEKQVWSNCQNQKHLNLHQNNIPFFVFVWNELFFKVIVQLFRYEVLCKVYNYFFLSYRLKITLNKLSLVKQCSDVTLTS